VESERLHFVESEAEAIHGPLYAIPGAAYPEWMYGDGYCPPDMMEFDPNMEYPSDEPAIPAPPPAIPPGAPNGPAIPPYEGNMGARGPNRAAPSGVVPAGGFQPTANNVQQAGAIQYQPAKEKKRPWYALPRR
jgi:hypothetical protein